MRMLVVGMEERYAKRIFEMSRGLADSGQVIPSWRDLEPAIAKGLPDVVAAYLGRQPGQKLVIIQRILALYPALPVIALIDKDTPELVKMISAAGCVDLALLKESPNDLRRALKALRKRGGTDTVEGEAVALLGAKGGVGTTTVACNLADTLAARMPDKRVVLVDLNLYMGDVALMLDISPDPTLLYFLKRAARADAKTWLEGPPLHRRGFRVMALDGDLESADPVSAEQVVFLVERLRQRYDYVVLDCGSDISEASLAACSTADLRLLVVTEQLAARMGARRRVAALRVLDPHRRSIQAIVNRCHNHAPEHLQQLEQTVGVSVLETLSNAWRDVVSALEQGRTLLEAHPRASITADFERLSTALFGQEHEQDRRKKAFFHLFR